MFKRIILILFISQLCFALSSKEARELTYKGIIKTNDYRIKSSAESGYCSTDMYMSNEKVNKYYKDLGFEISIPTSNIGEIISWCD